MLVKRPSQQSHSIHTNTAALAESGWRLSWRMLPGEKHLNVRDNKRYFPYTLTPRCSLMNTCFIWDVQGSHKFLLCPPVCTVAGIQRQMCLSVCSLQFRCKFVGYFCPWSTRFKRTFKKRTANLHFNILTATLVTRFGFSLSRPSASPITT